MRAGVRTKRDSQRRGGDASDVRGTSDDGDRVRSTNGGGKGDGETAKGEQKRGVDAFGVLER